MGHRKGIKSLKTCAAIIEGYSKQVEVGRKMGGQMTYEDETVIT